MNINDLINRQRPLLIPCECDGQCPNCLGTGVQTAGAPRLKFPIEVPPGLDRFEASVIFASFCTVLASTWTIAIAAIVAWILS